MLSSQTQACWGNMSRMLSKSYFYCHVAHAHEIHIQASPAIWNIRICSHYGTRIWIKTLHAQAFVWVWCWEMCTSALWLGCVGLLFATSQSCFQCFVDVQDSLRLCWGHILTEHNVRSVDACFRKLDRIFNHHEGVLEAGRVGAEISFLLFFLIMFHHIFFLQWNAFK